MGEQSGNYDEMSMHETILFADSLKDLKKLKTQLYSAAEYFELSYMNDDQKHIVVETLKDYAIKAVINTVDHLGSVTHKVAHLVDEKLDQVSDAQIRVSCVQQRVRTCNEYIEREGIAQQASIIHAPRYHKCYIAGETIKGASNLKDNLEDEDDWNQFRNAVHATLGGGTPWSSFRKEAASVSLSPAAVRPTSSRLVGSFSFSGTTTPTKDLADSSGRSTVSPHRFHLLRSGSLTASTTPKSGSTPTTPKSVVQQRQLQHQQKKPGKSASMRLHNNNNNNNNNKELQRYPSKSKRLLMALLTRRKSNKHEMLYTFLDEY